MTAKRKTYTKMTFEQAKTTYTHRYTCDYVPSWATIKCENGLYYAPQHASDQEWYDSLEWSDGVHSATQSWPHGKWLCHVGSVGRFITATPEFVKKLLEDRANDMSKLAAQFDLEFRCIVG